MDWLDILNIVFGALLGLGISVLLEEIRRLKERKNVERYIRSELSAIRQALETSLGKSGKSWPITETPNLSPLSPATAGVLAYDISSRVAKIQWAIKMTNELRLMAIQAARSNQEHEREIYAFACNDWLKDAKKVADELATIVGNGKKWY